jgi:hypothetical protein
MKKKPHSQNKTFKQNIILLASDINVFFKRSYFYDPDIIFDDPDITFYHQIFTEPRL